MARISVVLCLLAFCAYAHAQFALMDSALSRFMSVTSQVFHTLKKPSSAMPLANWNPWTSNSRIQAGNVSAWMDAGIESMGGIKYQRLHHPSFPDYQLRVAMDENDDEEYNDETPFCDPKVKQIKGYLDIRKDAHLWFIMFESRSDPSKDPLVLWLNGGPGCSSSTGMLFELGPCWVSQQGEDTTYNEHSWNSQANLLFLDQPLQVGYSYSDSGEFVDTSDKSAEDVYAFLQLFFARFPKYADLPFTVAAESYGGHYAPHIGAEIHRRNKELTNLPDNYLATAKPIRLDSLMIGNGLTDPPVQFPSVVEYACSPENKYHLFDRESETCKTLEAKSEVCTKLMNLCEKMDSRLSCVPAALYCWGSLYGPAQDTGVNLYDVRRKCDHEKDGDLCYPEMEHIETLLNKPRIKKMLGVPATVDFQSCNMQVNARFMMQGDSMQNSATLLAPLLADGIRVLAYAGEADFMCNAIGIHEWILDFQNVYREAINNATETPMFTHSVNGAKPRQAGFVIKAGKGAGNLAFVWIQRAGHMVPHDQPAVALTMLNRWLANEDLTV